jgi:hypothetical protein
LGDLTAQEIIAEWGRLDGDAATTMSLYQSIADHFMQRENAITKTTTPGEDKSLPVIDPIGRVYLDEMTAGLSSIFIPNGQFFFRLSSSDNRLSKNESVRSFLNTCTEIMHSEMFQAGFVREFNEYLTSMVAFGTGNLFCGWDKNDLELYYKDWDVANYRFSVDYKDRPNKCLIRWTYTALQAYELFGENAGPSILSAVKEPKKAQEKFVFIWRCQKRKNRDNTKADVLNYPWEEIVVSEKDKVVVSETGYQRFPYHICRWMLSSQSIWGEGQGGVALSCDKDLQTQKREYVISVNLHNRPAYEYLANNLEGEPRIYPGAANPVMELNSIKAIDQRMSGDTSRTLELIQDTRNILAKCFFVSVFNPMEGLTGDRRTRLEISLRERIGFTRLILPCTRIYDEGLTPNIVNTFHILLENGRFPPVPPELKTLKIDFLGRLALALQEQQSDALQRYSEFSLAMEPVIPGFTEQIINVRRAGKRMATTFGVNEADFNTEEEEAAILQRRAQEKQQMMMMQAAQAAGGTYKDASGKPEEGSPAAAMMEAQNA